MRIGVGYDIHPFQESLPAEGRARPLILGGVTLPGHAGLSGHSDADVLLHAVTDAVLGAGGLGDIGQHFPPEDPAWAGADSAKLLAKAAAKVQALGLSVEGIDATVIAQGPPLAPYLPRMREAIARSLGVAADQVNVKATSSEGLGAIGRGEGIAAIAVALLRETDELSDSSLR